MKLIFIPIIIPLVSILILSSNGSIISASLNYGVFTKDSSPYDAPYRNWMAKWWTWWLGIPNSLHQTNNYSDSKRCSVNQNGPVWFLPDIIVDVGKVNYTCNVPSDKAILLPLSTTICGIGEEGLNSDAQKADCADNILTPVSNIMASVDGKKVDVSKSFDKTNFFNVTFPQDPVTFLGEIKPGTYRAISTGYFLFLHDLGKGEHNIRLSVVDLLRGKEGPPPDFEHLREGNFKIVVQ